MIQDKPEGVMLVMDVDHFKQINDRYGHIAGDHLLQAVATVLDSMFYKLDILGRVGGDEFVVFLPINQDMRFIEKRGRQINEQLSEISFQDNISVTVGGSLCRADDDYSSLFDRADQWLISQKRSRATEKCGAALPMGPDSSRKLCIDLQLIQDELSEQKQITGAFYLDFKTFQAIYHFTERRLRRLKERAYLFLITLTNGLDDFPALGERALQMDALRESIQGSLRVGDVFTEYSSCQFLIMVSDCSSKNADCISTRICDMFCEKLPQTGLSLLRVHCHPLHDKARRQI